MFFHVLVLYKDNLVFKEIKHKIDSCSSFLEIIQLEKDGERFFISDFNLMFDFHNKIVFYFWGGEHNEKRIEIYRQKMLKFNKRGIKYIEETFLEEDNVL